MDDSDIEGYYKLNKQY